MVCVLLQIEVTTPGFPEALRALRADSQHKVPLKEILGAVLQTKLADRGVEPSRERRTPAKPVFQRGANELAQTLDEPRALYTPRMARARQLTRGSATLM